MRNKINPNIKFFLVVKPAKSSDSIYDICYAAYRIDDAHKLATKNFGDGDREYLLEEIPFENLPNNTVIRRTTLRMEDTYSLPWVFKTAKHAIAKAFDDNWNEVDLPFKVDYQFPNHPEWNTVENWHGDSDPNSINTVAESINDKKLKLCSTDFNPTIDLSDFKQSAVVSGNTLIVTFI